MGTVFISYVREDAVFARYLAAALRSAGLAPWLDEERLVAGNVLEEKLAAAIAGSDCAVFLVAPRFYKSSHCMNELRIFAERFPDKPRLPLLRRPRKELELPAYLGGLLVTQEWIDDETDRDQAIHLLLCAIRGVDPVPPEKRAEEGRKATASMPAEFVAPSIVHPRTSPRVAGIDLRSMNCDRAPEWNLFEGIYPKSCHHVVMIGGTRADAHDYFVLRIEQYLRAEPRFWKAPVDWRKRPKTKGEYLERIERALRALVPSGPVDLIAELRRWMASENLILVHSAIDRRYDDRTLDSYYGEWLPELMKEVGAAGSLKCIQPVVWDSSSRVAAVVRRFSDTPPRWLLSEAERKGRALIDRILALGSECNAAVSIELGPIRERDIRDFCQVERLTNAECEELLEEIRENDVTAPIALLDHIDDFMRRRQRLA